MFRLAKLNHYREGMVPLPIGEGLTRLWLALADMTPDHNIY